MKTTDWRTYVERPFIALQKYQYRCNCPSTGAWEDLKIGLIITREVFFDAGWFYRVSKTGPGNPYYVTLLPPQ